MEESVTGNGADARAHVRAVVTRSGTSFYWAMRLLPAARREGMYGIYAFCREVDDIADGPGEPAGKLLALDGWRAEVGRLYAGRPRHPITCALLDPVRRFGLPQAELLAVIDGVEMDARELMRAPSWGELAGYTRRVAGAVGLLSIRVFGAERAEAFALALGDALQLTNILRDVDEDAGRGRLYVPRELLVAHGVQETDPALALDRPGFADACAALAGIARERFERAETLLPQSGPRQLRPALPMMRVYRLLLERLVTRGFEARERPVRVSGLERLALAIGLQPTP
jgi:presqualene diphosphate synthase